MIKTGCPIEVSNARTSLLTLSIGYQKKKKHDDFVVISGRPKITRVGHGKLRRRIRCQPKISKYFTKIICFY